MKLPESPWISSLHSADHLAAADHDHLAKDVGYERYDSQLLRTLSACAMRPFPSLQFSHGRQCSGT